MDPSLLQGAGRPKVSVLTPGWQAGRQTLTAEPDGMGETLGTRLSSWGGLRASGRLRETGKQAACH